MHSDSVYNTCAGEGRYHDFVPFLSPLEFLCLGTPSQMSRYEMAASGAKRTLIRASRSDEAKLYNYFNNKRVCNFILNGAPIK